MCILQLLCFPSHVNVMFVFIGIEDVFLSTAVGLIRLAQDSLCSSLRICDLTDPMSPVSNVGNDPFVEGDGSGGAQNHHTLQMTSLAHAEVERTRMCC
jgi:hypothetical protein